MKQMKKVEVIIESIYVNRLIELFKESGVQIFQEHSL